LQVVKDVKIEKQEVEESKHRIDEEGGDLTKVPKELELDDTLEEKDADEDGEHPKLSKRKLKKLSRLSVAELKQLVTRPGKLLKPSCCIPFAHALTALNCLYNKLSSSKKRFNAKMKAFMYFESTRTFNL
jgi:hypothetical protein